MQDMEQYLRPLVDEVNYLTKNGLCLHGVSIPFRLRCIIADALARAFIKGVKCFNPKDGCLKCPCVVEYLPTERKVIF
uniref:Uncharacterized protein n=1 Tax=Anopheles dirus TaxID=7168 RepID=A0A182NQ37_9DIPT